MKRFTFKVKNHPLAYISSLDIEYFFNLIRKGFRSQLDKERNLNINFNYYSYDWSFSSITKLVKRCPKNVNDIIHAAITETNQPVWYVLDKKKINVKPYDGNNDALFAEQERMLNLINNLNLGENINLPRFSEAHLQELNYSRADFMKHLLTLCEAKLLLPVYRINTDQALINEENQWTAQLKNLAKNFTTVTGQIINGQELQNIQIDFQRV